MTKPNEPADLLAEVERIEVLMERATPGPWYLFNKNNVLQISDSCEATNETAVVHWMGFDSSDKPRSTSKSNARLMVALHNSAQALIDAVRRGERMRQALQHFVDVCDTAPPIRLVQMLGEACTQARQALAEVGKAQASTYQYDETTIKARYP